jgi:hypothetical protein
MFIFYSKYIRILFEKNILFIIWMSFIVIYVITEQN